MSASKFQIVPHTIDAQHIREYPKATRYQDDARLKVHVKQYRPLNNLQAKEGSITIIGLHANGFPKETYEPLWDDLLDTANGINLPIRSIWIADCSHQGQSGVINEDVQGEDPSYFDHARDLLHLINVFRDEMVAPIFGIGHSMGAAQLAQLCYIHPRLFHSVALVEPVIQDSAPEGPNPSMFAALRPDLFYDRTAAESGLKYHPMFKSMDPRVLKRYAEVGFQDLPTRLYPDVSRAEAILSKSKSKGGKDAGRSIAPSDNKAPIVTLATTKHQEAWSYSRANFAPLPIDPADPIERLISPDQVIDEEGQHVFIRPELLTIFRRLPELRPATLWLYGESSFINSEEIREKKSLTGTGRGGSGGLKSGQVKEIIIEDAGHMLPFEKPAETASVLADWLVKQTEQWRSERLFHQNHSSGRSSDEGLKMSKQYREAIMEPMDLKRPTREKL